MRHLLTTLFALATISIAAASGAQAMPVIGKGDLNRHCVAKYQPRGIQAMADRYTAPLSGQLRCRLSSIHGFTNENQSNGEVCRRLTGNANWTNSGTRVSCGSASPASTNRNSVLRHNVPTPRVFQRCTRWIWNGRAFVCR